MTHPLLKIADDQDAVILSMSRAVAQPKRTKPAPVRHPVHAMCLAMSEVYQYEPNAAAQQPAAAEIAAETLAEDAADSAAVAAPDADGWVPFECTPTSVCPVAECEVEIRLRDGTHRTPSETDTKAPPYWCLWNHVECGVDVVAYRIIKPAAAPAQPADQDRYRDGWRKDSEIPAVDRTGLWHYDNPAYGGQPDAAGVLIYFDLPGVYRRAPEDAQPGDKYDERRYWRPNTGVQPVADAARVEIRLQNGEVEECFADDTCWGLGHSTVTHWRLSREQK